jgi:broad specificity phosphatase PhoE
MSSGANGSNESKVELWLVRHGETEWSADGRHTSVTDIPLTERGRERARELRDYFAGRKFAAVFVSPMQRARETCEIAGYGDVAIVDKNLMEWNYGESEGKTTAEMREKYGPGWSVWTNKLVGGESVEQVGERADAMIARSLAAVSPNAGKPTQVALFAHAHILRILAARWITLPPVDGKLFALGTGSVSVLGYEREQRVISRWNRSFEE